MTYKIDADVPAPATKIGVISLERQALDKLQVGQSILFPADKAKRALTAAVNKHDYDRAWGYVSKKQPDGSRRIWRLT